MAKRNVYHVAVWKTGGSNGWGGGWASLERVEAHTADEAMQRGEEIAKGYGDAYSAREVYQQ